MKKKRVVLIQGGMGAEREVSLSTGAGFAQALRELDYPFEVVDAKEDLPLRLAEINADVALLALHGKYAEDGTVQGICEYLKLPYSGSGVLASALCMDKLLTKQVLLKNEVPTPDYIVIDNRVADVKTVKPPFGLPVVVKPSREGSSVGVTVVKTESEWRPALELACQYDRNVLVEKFIAGMELTVSILKDKALMPIEIVPKVDFYDYKNKYTAGRTEYILPPRLDSKIIDNVREIALHAFNICRCRSYARVDFRVDPDGNPFVIEINTLPGCTPTSLLPKSANYEGISFNQLVETLVETAGLDYAGVR